MFLFRYLRMGVMILLTMIIGGNASFMDAALRPAPLDGSERMADAEKSAYRAQVLAESYYDQFYSPLTERLSYYPYDTKNTGSCWDYIGLISLTYKLSLMDRKYLCKMDSILEGLRYYRKVDANGKFLGYVVPRAECKDKTDSDGIAYDDNMWLARDFVSFYELTGDEKYLKLAAEIGDLLIDIAYDDLPASIFAAKGWEVKSEPVGGFYWDYRIDAIHTCSTGPAAQFFAALYRVTNKETYLTHAKAAYNLLSYLENKEYGGFWDLMRFDKDENNNITGILRVEGPSYTYNSGSPMTAAAELHRVTGEARYLEDGKAWAAAADKLFAKDSSVDGIKNYLPATRLWFNLILLNGFTALQPYAPEMNAYIESMSASIHYAYENYRTAGLFGIHENALPQNWVDGFDSKEGYYPFALDFSASAEIFAALHYYYAKLK